MADRLLAHPTARAAGLALILLTCPAWAAAESKADAKKDTPHELAQSVPALWGYGVKPCGDFLASAPADSAPADLADEDYLRYREWLAGLVTGLNLATGRDVLGGAELDAALIRIRASCKAHPRDDFFNASLRLVRSLGHTGKK
jgi:hypothetical protein